VEDQLGRVRESLVAEAAGSQDLVTSVKSTTRTVQVVGIAVCALLGFVLVMVMLLFLHSR
jgi:cell division protein FtsX